MLATQFSLLDTYRSRAKRKMLWEIYRIYIYIYIVTSSQMWKMCWNKGRLCWKIPKLIYFCHLKKLVRPETFGPYYVHEGNSQDNVWSGCHLNTSSKQGCTNPRHQAIQVTKFCTLVPIICGSSIWKLLDVILLLPKILRRLLVFFFFFKLWTPVVKCYCYVNLLSVKLTEPSLGQSTAVLWAIVFSSGNGSKQKWAHLQLLTDFLTEGWHLISRCNKCNTGTISICFVPANRQH